MTIRANMRWVQDLQFVGRAGEGPAVVIDSTKGGSGASPMGLLLLAGENIKPKGGEQAIALSEEKYCSALASLNASVTHTYRIE